MIIYGVIHLYVDSYHVALIDSGAINNYGNIPVVFVNVEKDKEIPMLQYEALEELIDTWNPYSGDMVYLVMGSFDKYGNFVNEVDSEVSNASPMNKICTYKKGELKKVTYEKI